MEDQNIKENVQTVSSLPEPHGELPNPDDKKRLPETTKSRKGGFMNGGLLMTLMFLMAFFLSSFSFGVYYERNIAKDESIASITQKIDKLAQMAESGGAGAAGGVLGLQDGSKIEDQIPLDEKRVKGNANAKVTMVVYSDFECPYCKSFYDNAYKDIVQKYVNNGQVKIAFKDYPLGFHLNAQSSAEASRCAAEQGKFWELHDRMFENQKSLSVDNYKKWASELSLDTGTFNNCVDNKKYATAVQDDLSEGTRIGVQGTPMFVINGEVLVGAQPSAAFETIIQKYL